MKWLLGAGLQITGSISVNLGSNMVKQAHEKHKSLKKKTHDSELASAQTKRLKMMGWGLFTLGNVLNFASFSFAAQSLLACLGSVQFVSNVLFSRYFLQVPVTWLVFWATAAILAGNGLIVVSASHETLSYTVDDLAELFVNEGFIIYMIGIAVASSLLQVWYWSMSGGIVFRLKRYRHVLLKKFQGKAEHEAGKKEQQGEEGHTKAVAAEEDEADARIHMESREGAAADAAGRAPGREVSMSRAAFKRKDSAGRVEGLKNHPLALPICYAMVSGMIGTFSVTLAKACSLALSETMSGNNQLKNGYTYLFFGAWFFVMLFWLYRMNQALKLFFAYIIPILQVVWILFSVLGGGIFYQEFDKFDEWQYILFVLGIVIIFGGVLGIAIAGKRSAPLRSALSRTLSRVSFRSRMSHFDTGEAPQPIPGRPLSTRSDSLVSTTFLPWDSHREGELADKSFSVTATSPRHPHVNRISSFRSDSAQGQRVSSFAKSKSPDSLLHGNSKVDRALHEASGRSVSFKMGHDGEDELDVMPVPSNVSLGQIPEYEPDEELRSPTATRWLGLGMMLPLLHESEDEDEQDFVRSSPIRRQSDPTFGQHSPPSTLDVPMSRSFTTHIPSPPPDDTLAPSDDVEMEGVQVSPPLSSPSTPKEAIRISISSDDLPNDPIDSSDDIGV